MNSEVLVGLDESVEVEENVSVGVAADAVEVFVPGVEESGSWAKPMRSLS